MGGIPLGATPSRVWIDLTNSPHVLFFEPIIAELEKRGARVELTARDYAQTLDLLDRHGLEHVAIGRHQGKSVARKAVGFGARALRLMMYAWPRKFDLALSFSSNDLALAAYLLRVPHIAFHDYEFTELSFRLNAHLIDCLFVPQAIPDSALAVYGIGPERVEHFPGLKEHVYLRDFTPDPAVLSEVCAEDERRAATRPRVLVTVRPPATMSAYHRFENPLFFDVLKRLGSDSNARVVVLARTLEQRRELRPLLPPNAVMPESALDGPSLIFHSDLVVSAGGTMNREAAVLGTPVYSIFRGKHGAVDADLEARGFLRRIESADEIQVKPKRRGEPYDVENLEYIVEAMLRRYRELISAVPHEDHPHRGEKDPQVQPQ